MGEKKKFKTLSDLKEIVKSKMGRYKYKVIVMSGKGGVGKSFVSSMLALGLAMHNRRVTLFDADIQGSSIPMFLGIQGQRHYLNENGEIDPVEGPLGVKVVASNLMLDSPDMPIVWRGPLMARAIVELVTRVAWGEGDYLVVDMPPGTGDVPLTVAQVIPLITGGILVTAPNTLNETIVAKAANFTSSVGIRLLGLIENMSYFKCPSCGKVTYIMGNYTSERLAAKYSTQLLGKIPIDPEVNEAIEQGRPYLLAKRDGEAAKVILSVVDKVIKLVENK